MTKRARQRTQSAITRPATAPINGAALATRHVSADRCANAAATMIASSAVVPQPSAARTAVSCSDSCTRRNRSRVVTCSPSRTYVATNNSPTSSANAATNIHCDSRDDDAITAGNADAGASAPGRGDQRHRSVGYRAAAGVAQSARSAARSLTNSGRSTRSPTLSTATAIERRQPSGVRCSTAAGCPSIQRATILAPRSESCGKPHCLTNGDTTTAPAAATAPTVSDIAR